MSTDYVCVCGNDSDRDGFYPCDSVGQKMEPNVGSDWGGLYVCERCGTVTRMTESVYSVTFRLGGDSVSTDVVLSHRECDCRDCVTVLAMESLRSYHGWIIDGAERVDVDYVGEMMLR